MFWKALRNNLIPKIVCLMLATGLWFYVQNINDKRSSYYAQLDRPALPPGFILTRSWKDRKVQLKFRRDDSWVLGTDKTNWRVVPTLVGTAKTGMNEFSLALNEDIPAGHEIEIHPPKLNLQLSRSASRQVPVKEVINEISEEFAFQLSGIEPDQVTLSGPREVLQTVKRVYTRPVTLPEKTGLFEKSVELDTFENLEIKGAKNRRVVIKGTVVDKKNYQRVSFSAVNVGTRLLAKNLAAKVLPGATDITLLVPRDIEFDSSQLKAFVNCSRFFVRNNQIQPADKVKNLPIELDIPAAFTDSVIILDIKPEDATVILRIKDIP